MAYCKDSLPIGNFTLKGALHDVDDTTFDMGSLIGFNEIKEDRDIWRMLAAEFIGTLFLVLIGCGSCIDYGDTPSTVQIALTFGLTVATLAQCLGHVSGCHINPAVTVGLLSSGDIKLIKAICYIIAQCVGAIAGSAILKVIVPAAYAGTLGSTAVSAAVTSLEAFLIEVVLTFLLVFVVQAVCDPKRTDIKGSAPLAIGLSITAGHLSGVSCY
ncbi:aquaporin AQPAn.G-like [Agrilus planipennis]|uniref:Aquaporin AQPAn.G-like n=1 Tax=Agrilus planipennis TaxID=224129 RepID=A0A7F5R4N3_AGRPL|nr:aquaporin AQPAn.G-like [Agrilus planipennis]